MAHPYYREHLSFLIEGGRALAKAFPRAAERLARPGLDPDVERLLEGIAFITGKIEEKHDEDLLLTCQLMFDVLFPHYLCPVPSAAVVELQGPSGRIPAGTELSSVPVLSTPCRFRTAYEVELSGVSIRDVSWQAKGRSAQLGLELELEPGVELAELTHLRLHFHGEPLLTRSLFYWLQRRLERLELVDGDGRVVASSATPRLRALGYADDEWLLSYPPGSFEGFRLLQEYFTLPHKFLFLEVGGLAELLREARWPDAASRRRFGLRFHLGLNGSHSFAVTRQNIRLGCTPVINLFPHSADPLVRDLARVEYPLRPAGPHRHYEIYRVQEVSGHGPDGVVHYPLLSELDLTAPDQPFSQHLRREREGQILSYVSLNDAGRLPPANQTLMADLLCTNGELPLGLRVGDLCYPATPYESWRAQFLTPLTRPVPVSVGEDLRWRLIKHLTLAQEDLTSLAGLRDSVTLYHSRAQRDEQAARGLSLICQGMRQVETRAIQHPYQRALIWGLSTELTLDETAFDTEGESYLFGCILNELTALQSPINTFSEFGLRRAQSQEVLKWPKRLGRNCLQS